MVRQLLALAFVSLPLHLLAQSKADPAKPDPAVCDALVQAIDLSHRRAVLDDILARMEGRSPVHQLALAANELSTINLNVTLLAANRCPPLRYPLSIPGPYSKAASTCAVSLIGRRSSPSSEDDPCIVTKWQRDP
jgi:hypothetical protein